MNSKNNTLLIVLLMMFALPTALACAFDNATNDKIIELAFDNFWGKAKLPDGSYVRPESETDRRTLPISKEAAYQVIEVGKASGFAKWCSLDWERNFFTLMAAARKEGFSQKQVAFIGVLHGVSMGVVQSATKDQRNCTSEEKERVTEMLKRSPNTSLPRPR